jgi:uncharacterized protein (TIGR00369 family)
VAAEGPRGLDGLTRWMGLRWDDPNTVRVTIRDDLMNLGGLLSGVVAYTLVDYCMGSTLWQHRNPGEAIATTHISITYLQTATEGDVICATEMDRRNRTSAALRSEVRHEDGRLLATAQGTYAIFPRKRGMHEAPAS